MKKTFNMRKLFISLVSIFLLAGLLIILLVSVNQVDADTNDDLVILESVSATDHVVIAKNVQNYIDKCRKEGLTDREICTSVYQALKYENEDMPDFTIEEIENFMGTTEISVQEMFFEVESDGTAEPVPEEKAVQGVALANKWNEDGYYDDVNGKGWLSCKLVVSQNYLYDENNTVYNKDEKIHISDKYGYVLKNEWKWLKFPTARLNDEFFISWDSSVVDIVPGYYDCAEMKNIYNKYEADPNRDLKAYKSEIEALGSYSYILCKMSNGDIGHITVYSNDPLDASIARFNYNLPTVIMLVDTIEFHTRLIFQSKTNKIEDFFIDTGYAHKWIGFTGSISINSAGQGSYTIQPRSFLDEYNVNVRKAHVGPQEGWTYS